jgi:hypothetical protein
MRFHYENKRPSQPNNTPLGRTFVLITIGLGSVLVMMACISPFLVWPLYDKYIQAKANGSPSPRAPRLNFFMVPYDAQKHVVSPFVVKELESCLGFSLFFDHC